MSSPHVAIKGVLLENARHYTNGSGHPQLHVVIGQQLEHRLACPIKAVYHYPDTGTPHVTAQLASQAAAAMPRGTEVLVTGEGLLHDHHNGHPVLAVGRVQHIAPTVRHVAQPYHAPTGDH